MPAKMTFAGEKTCEQTIRGRSLTIGPLEDYQANTLAEDIRKCTEDGKSGIEPLLGAVTISLKSNELLNIVKDS